MLRYDLIAPPTLILAVSSLSKRAFTASQADFAFYDETQTSCLFHFQDDQGAYDEQNDASSRHWRYPCKHNQSGKPTD